MRRRPLVLVILAASLAAQDASDPFGHSRHGSEFNEGPRQAAYLMPGMSDEVNLPVAGLSAEAQLFFNQGVTQLHGFWYYEAERSFRQVARLHPECGMAHWGMAMANFENAERATGFIAEAVARSADAPRYEQLWIDAWATYRGVDDAARKELQSGDAARVDARKAGLVAAQKQTGDDPKKQKADKEKRELRLLKDLGTLVYEFPDDLEAKAFLAIQNWHAYAWGSGVAIVSHTAVDALIDQVLAKAPRHPVHHYRIHLWDREAGERALKSAAAIGDSAPAIAHQWHMAGHIYAKLNRHAEAAWQQEASGRVDHAHMQRDRVMPFAIHNYGHNQEWLSRSLSHTGDAHAALDLAKNMAELPRHPKLNKPDQGGDIAGYARKRLVEICEDHGLWGEAVALCRDGHIEVSDDLKGEVARLGLLGRALFRLGRIDEGERIVEQAAELLVRARAERAAAIDTAEDLAIAEKRARKEIDDAVDEARRGHTDVVRQALDLQHELRGERLLAHGDAKAALAEFEVVKGLPVTLLADAHLAAGDADKAIELLSKEVESRPGRQPTLSRLLAVHRAVGRPESAAKIEELQSALGKLSTDMRTYGADFGSRPPIESLGPFRWSPMPAPELDLPIVAGAGEHFRLAAAGGQPTLVVFYLGFGCLHCIEQLQAIAPAAHAFADAGIRIVAVGSDTAAKAAESLAALSEAERFPFRMLADPSLSAFKAWRCYDDFEAMPLHGTFLVDGDGKVRWSDVSFEPFTEIDWLLNESRRLLHLPLAAGGK